MKHILCCLGLHDYEEVRRRCGLSVIDDIRNEGFNTKRVFSDENGLYITQICLRCGKIDDGIARRKADLREHIKFYEEEYDKQNMRKQKARKLYEEEKTRIN
jgi:hypothetical protein